jgi:hypothetical protein
MMTEAVSVFRCHLTHCEILCEWCWSNGKIVGIEFAHYPYMLSFRSWMLSFVTAFDLGMSESSTDWLPNICLLNCIEQTSLLT